MRASSVLRVAPRLCGAPSRYFSVKVTTEMIKELRALTGAPMMECKAALSAAEVRDRRLQFGNPPVRGCRV